MANFTDGLNNLFTRFENITMFNLIKQSKITLNGLEYEVKYLTKLNKVTHVTVH